MLDVAKPRLLQAVTEYRQAHQAVLAEVAEHTKHGHLVFNRDMPSWARYAAAEEEIHAAALADLPATPLDPNG